MPDTYTDGISCERCLFCLSALRDRSGQALTIARIDDLEELIVWFSEYLGCDSADEVWGDLLKRFEQAVGQTYAQIKRRRCERLSKQVSTS